MDFGPRGSAMAALVTKGAWRQLVRPERRLLAWRTEEAAGVLPVDTVLLWARPRGAAVRAARRVEGAILLKPRGRQKTG